MSDNKTMKKIALMAGVPLAVGYMLNRRKIKTINSVKRLGPEFFELDYRDDYYLADFLQKGAGTNRELLDFIASKLLYGYEIKLDPIKNGCTGFVTIDKHDHRLFSHNYDSAHTPVIVTHYRPKKGYASLCMAELGIFGINKDNLPDVKFMSAVSLLALPYFSLDGINEMGLAMSINAFDGRPVKQHQGKTPMVPTAALRAVLDRCADVAEAVAMLKQFDMRSATEKEVSFMLADVMGRVAVIRYEDDKLVVLEQNHFAAAQNEESLETKLKGNENLFDRTGCMKILEEFSMNEEKTATQWSIVYNLNKLDARISIQNDYKTPYYFRLER